MNTTCSALSPDRLIWMPLSALLAAALIAGQARANLHPEARATAPATAAFDEPFTAEAWCRMHLDSLTGDEALGFDQGMGDGFDSSSTFGRTLPVSTSRRGDRPFGSLDASL